MFQMSLSSYIVLSCTDSQTWQRHLSRYHPRLEFLDQHPEELIKFVQQLKSTRLGLRFEMLVWFWLLDDAYHPVSAAWLIVCRRLRVPRPWVSWIFCY